jgi:hypothetical protein
MKIPVALALACASLFTPIAHAQYQQFSPYSAPTDGSRALRDAEQRARLARGPQQAFTVSRAAASDSTRLTFADGNIITIHRGPVALEPSAVAGAGSREATAILTTRDGVELLQLSDGTLIRRGPAEAAAIGWNAASATAGAGVIEARAPGVQTLTHLPDGTMVLQHAHGPVIVYEGPSQPARALR